MTYKYKLLIYEKVQDKFSSLKKANPTDYEEREQNELKGDLAY